MTLKNQFAAIVGSDHVIDSLRAIKEHSRDFSITPAGHFSFIVQPADTPQVQAVIKLANETKVPLTPSSSGVHFNGSTIPRTGGVLLDLRRMNRIKEIDEASRVAHLEPGVTWGEFVPALKAKGYRSIMPLLPHSRRSVITDWLEREQPTIHVTEYAEPIMSMQVVWGNGEEFVTGSASINNFRQPGCLADGTNPMGPGTLSFWRFLQGAQGTMGVVTWGIVKVEDLPGLSKALFIPSEHLEDTVEPLYQITRRRLGYECFVLDNLTMATIIAEKWPADFPRLRATLPPWTIVLILGALKRRPEEKLAYEEEALEELRQAHFPGLKVLPSLPGAAGAEKKLPEMLRQPWPEDRPFWKHAWKGACQDLIFMTTLDQSPAFTTAVLEAATGAGFNNDHVGVYLQPVENGRACQITISFYYMPEDSVQVELVRDVYFQTATAAVEHGSYFNRPYGPVADMVFRHAGDYATTLKRLKSLFDPNGILNAGRLCF